MSNDVDFLPHWYRAGTWRKRANRERLLLTIPVILALAAVDIVLRLRVVGVREMATHAREHADYGDRLARESKHLTEEANRLHEAVTRLAMPLSGRRMTEVLDGLLVDRPDGIGFHDLAVHQSPWSDDLAPQVTAAATCASAGELKDYLEALRASAALPALQCQRTDQTREGAAFAFALETKSQRRAR